MYHRLVRPAILGLLGFFSAVPAPALAELLLDDFRTPGVSSAGTAWEGFTDRVMGGLTQMESGWGTEGGQPFLRLQGRVRTENNGGFLQMRMPAAPGGVLDARPWTGVAVLVRGSPGAYAVHLRTAQNWLPWNFYTAPLPVTGEWTEVRLPFSSFRGDYGASGQPELRTLRTVALAAIGRSFDARLDVRRLSLYSEEPSSRSSDAPSLVR